MRSSSLTMVIFLHFFWETCSHRERGFESCSKMAILRRSAVLMRPPYSKLTPKDVYAQIFWSGRSWQKLVKSLSFCCSPMLKWGRKWEILHFSKFPRSNSKLSVGGLPASNPCPLYQSHARKSLWPYIIIFDICVILASYCINTNNNHSFCINRTHVITTHFGVKNEF